MHSAINTEIAEYDSATLSMRLRQMYILVYKCPKSLNPLKVPVVTVGGVVVTDVTVVGTGVLTVVGDAVVNVVGVVVVSAQKTKSHAITDHNSVNRVICHFTLHQRS